MPFTFDLFEQPEALREIAEAGIGEVAELGGPGLGTVVLPEDETAHKDTNEWWYFKGHFHLADTPARRFSFLAVILKQRIIGADVAVGIYKRIDHAGGASDSPVVGRAQALRKTYSGSVDPVRTSFAFGKKYGGSGDKLEWSVVSAVRGLRDLYRLRAEGEHGLELELEEQSPAVLVGTNGIVDYGGGETLAYYLRPDLVVSGNMMLDGKRRPVVGTAWMEHQWGEAAVRKFKWKYVAVQLDNGERWMFYRVKHPKAAAELFYGAQLRDGRAHVVPVDLLQLRDVAVSGGKYATGTDIQVFADPRRRVKALKLTVRATFEDQLVDVSVPGVPKFWEGACTVTGQHDGVAVSGLAMTEITG